MIVLILIEHLSKTIFQISQKIGSHEGILVNNGKAAMCPTDTVKEKWRYGEQKLKSDVTISIFCKGIFGFDKLSYSRNMLLKTLMF